MVSDFRPGGGDEEKVYIHQGFPSDELGETDVIAYGHGAGKTIQLKMGQLVSHKAMEMAIEKAKTTGVGIVSVRNSNHYGIAGYYAKMACKELVDIQISDFFY